MNKNSFFQAILGSITKRCFSRLGKDYLQKGGGDVERVLKTMSKFLDPGPLEPFLSSNQEKSQE